MVTKTKEVEVSVEHPMEEVLDLPPGSTMLPYIQRETELSEAETYDKKDVEIEDQFQEVYDSAMEGYESQVAETQLVDGRYKARNGEIAVAFLNTALAAAREKLNLKQHKDKLEVSKIRAGTPGKVNQNVIVADRNEILKSIFNKNDED